MSSFVTNFPLFSIILSLLCAVITSILRGRAARGLTIFLTSAVAAMNLSLLIYTTSLGTATTYMMGHFPAPWGNEIRFGVLEPLMTLILGSVVLLCVLGGGRYILRDIDENKRASYYTMIDLVQAAILALSYTNDLFTGYVFIEICTLSSCGILIIRGIGRTTLAAMRYMIFNLLGSGLFLFGVIILYDITGHLLMPNIKESVAALAATGEYKLPLTVTIALMSIGLSIKSGLFPFHFWMPDTYGYSTPTSSGILSGVISKIYIFFLIKVISSVIGVDVFYESGVNNILFLFGLCGMIVGSISAIRENDINRMTAYSSASQIGYIYMGIGLSPELGLLAAVYQIIAHALTKPGLFLSAARLVEVSGNSRKFVDLQGSARRNKLAGVAFTVGALSMVGLPCFMGFIVKFLFADAAASYAGIKMLPALIALAVSTVLNTVYFLRTVIRIYTPNPGIKVRLYASAQKAFIFATTCLAAINVFFGLQSGFLIDLLQRGLELL